MADASKTSNASDVSSASETSSASIPDKNVGDRNKRVVSTDAAVSEERAVPKDQVVLSEATAEGGVPLGPQDLRYLVTDRGDGQVISEGRGETQDEARSSLRGGLLAGGWTDYEIDQLLADYDLLAGGKLIAGDDTPDLKSRRAAQRYSENG